MRFEKLKPNKIKIVITNDDLLEWGVSAEAIASNRPETKEMFISLLRQAERETGFVCDNSRLVVEVSITPKDNDITLFVTRVSNEEERAVFDKISAIKKVDTVNISALKKRLHNDVVFEIDDFETVIDMCYVMRNYFGGAIYEYRDKYYVIVERFIGARLSEFGRECKNELIPIVKEHGNAICERNAFTIIRINFKK